jgi:transcriptional regulator with XRE-family HTH domain
MEHAGSIDATLAALGERARRLRVLRGLTQADLAARAGVGTATLHRFERTGRATTENVVRIAVALHAEDALAGLFAAPAFASLDEVLERPESGVRRRVRRRS